MVPSVILKHPNRSFRKHQLSVRDEIALGAVQSAIDRAALGISDPGPVVEHPTYTTAAAAETLPGPKFCIIGAGTAGLYTAMILDSLNIEYDILEANEERTGGRVFTHRFNGQAGLEAPVGDPARYDYVDIDLLVEYKMSTENNISSYNGHTMDDAPVTGDPFQVSVTNGGTVPDTYADVDYSMLINKIYGPFKEAFAELDKVPPEQRQAVFKNAWDLLTTFDAYSTRGFMRSANPHPDGFDPKHSGGLEGPGKKVIQMLIDHIVKKPVYPEPVVEYLEMLDSATGLYDEAFVESVIDSLDFDWPSAKVSGPPLRAKAETQEFDWFCIDGGTDRLTLAMEALIKSKPMLGKQVFKIVPVTTSQGSPAPLTVSFNHTRNSVITGFESKSYSQVISTVPLGCLQVIDTSALKLSYNQKTAIRSLQYDASTKIGLKFRHRWWQPGNNCIIPNPIVAGKSLTDRPIRTVVYPSYGLNVPDAPGVMLASYTWAQDARRLASLAQGKGTPADADLLEQTLQELAELHGLKRENLPEPEDHFAYNWYGDRYARGAFALFGPGEFGRMNSGTSLFASLKAPSPAGTFHIAGEATSVHHAWILGAVNSAWRAVYNALDGNDAKQRELIDKWGIPDEESEVHLKKLVSLAHHKVI